MKNLAQTLILTCSMLHVAPVFTMQKKQTPVKKLKTIFFSQPIQQKKKSSYSKIGNAFTTVIMTLSHWDAHNYKYFGIDDSYKV
jgi:hypothetical protein